MKTFRFFSIFVALVSSVFGQEAGPLVTQAVNSASPRTWTLNQWGVPLQIDMNTGALITEAAGGGAVSLVNQFDFSASGSITTQNLNPNTGTATAGSTVAITGLNGIDTLNVQVSGTYTGALTVQGTVDGTNWVSAPVIEVFSTNATNATILSAATGVFQVGVEGFTAARVTALAAVTGTAVITVRGTNADFSVALDTPLPPGTNVIGIDGYGQASTTAGQSGPLAQAAATSAAPSYTTAQTNPLSMNLSGALRINLASIGNTVIADTGSGILAVGGNVAAGSTSTSDPEPTGGTVLSTVPAAAIANGKAEYIPMTGDQQVIVHQDGDPSNEWSATSGVTPLASNTSTALIAAGGSGIRHYATGIQVYNTSATVSTNISILDGATVIWTGYAAATTASLPVVPVTVEFRTPLKGTAATAMNIQCGTTGASVYYNVQGFNAN